MLGTLIAMLSLIGIFYTAVAGDVMYERGYRLTAWSAWFGCLCWMLVLFVHVAFA